MKSLVEQGVRSNNRQKPRVRRKSGVSIETDSTNIQGTGDRDSLAATEDEPIVWVQPSEASTIEQQ